MADKEIPYKLEYISTITGIRLSHLQRMLDGEISPSKEHRHELVKALGADVAAKFSTHKKALPQTIDGHATRKVPNGYQLVEYMPAVEIIAGDLIAYRSPLSASAHNQRSGAVRWVKVLDVPGVVDIAQSTDEAAWGEGGRDGNLVVGDEVHVVIVVESDQEGKTLTLRIPTRSPVRVARRKGEKMVMSKAVYGDIAKVEGKYLAAKAASTLPYNGWTTELPAQ